MAISVSELMDWARRRKLVAMGALVVTLGIGILIGSIISGGVGASFQQVKNVAAPLPPAPEPVTLSSAFASITVRLEPAVVNISTTQVIEQRRGQRRGGNEAPNDLFDRFFDFPQGGRPRAERSLGSGVIVDKSGFILTNRHVVDEATKIQVKLQNDPRDYTARVIGSDNETDLAIIKIDAGRDLPFARLGNSDAVQQGDWVLAFGSPFGLDATVTAGIVSAKNRATVEGTTQFQRFIQTDAAINPGNSGGPLVNMAGEVIGINTAIYTSNGGFDGVGFAMPSNVARDVYNQIVTAGKVVRGAIGITFDERSSSNPLTLKELGVSGGIIIESVTAGGPAEKAGLKETDVITAINGQPVKTGSDLVDPVSHAKIGETVRLTVVRDRKPMELTVAVADRNEISATRAGMRQDDNSGPGTSAELGFRVEDLTPDLAERFGGRRGVIVAAIEPASFAEDINLARGDVITSVNRQPVGSVAEYRQMISRLRPGQTVTFTVARNLTDGRGNGTVVTKLLSGTVPGAQ